MKQAHEQLLVPTARGIYCPAGDFYIDPWRPVDRAVITHAHSDHARSGSQRYVCTEDGVALLRARLDEGAAIASLPYGQFMTFNGVAVSLHPAGHLLGSAQVRVEHGGDVWVVSGDYKLTADPTCRAFEPVSCHTFITECTFGLPIYRWPDPHTVHQEINEWWRSNQAQGYTTVILAYALGKAQRVLAGLDASIGPIIVHGAVDRFVRLYCEAGVDLPPVQRVRQRNGEADRGHGLVIAPLSARGTPWMRRFGPCRTAMVSGWMQVRGARRRRAVDRGFVLSDHADWNELLSAIRATGAERIGVTHGYTEPMVRYLKEQGLQAWAIETRFEGEVDDPRSEEPDNDV